MESVYVALLRANQKWKSRPIIASDDLNVIKSELDEYFNITIEYEKCDNTKNRCLGFTYSSINHVSDYKGYYTYEEMDSDGLKNIIYIDVYLVDYILKNSKKTPTLNNEKNEE